MNKQTFHIILFILFSFSVLLAKGQTNERKLYKDLAKPYHNLKQNSKDNHPQIKFLNGDSIYQNCGKELMQIMIIRHQKVDLQKQSSYSYNEAKRYFEAYDTARIFPLNFSPVTLRNNEIDTIFTSTLPRAIETTVALFGDSIPIFSYEIFREYRKELPLIPFIQLPLGFWRFSSSTEWVTGWASPDSETFEQGKERAKLAGRFLEIKSDEKGKTVLVGHGFINHYIKKYLKKNGWKMIIDGKNKNLGITLFVKVKP